MRFFLLAVAVLSSQVFAQTTAPAKQAAPKPQNINFADGTPITGELATPLGDIYFVPPRPNGFKNLIKVRMNFDDKLRNSVNEM